MNCIKSQCRRIVCSQNSQQLLPVEICLHLLHLSENKQFVIRSKQQLFQEYKMYYNWQYFLTTVLIFFFPFVALIRHLLSLPSISNKALLSFFFLLGIGFVLPLSRNNFLLVNQGNILVKWDWVFNLWTNSLNQ